MMEIFEEEIKEYRLVYNDVHGDGYSFPCDEDGNILWAEVPSPDTTKKSLAYCKAHQDKWMKNGEVVTFVTRERYGICPRCGRRVYFGCGERGGRSVYVGMTECDCGQWYNIFGQALKPPEDWGWDDDCDDDWVDEWHDGLIDGWDDDLDDSWDDWDPDYYEYWDKMWHGPFTSREENQK